MPQYYVQIGGKIPAQPHSIFYYFPETRGDLENLEKSVRDSPLTWLDLFLGMPDDEFDHDKFASGGCVIPSAWPPDGRCSGCRFEGYRDVISGFEM